MFSEMLQLEEASALLRHPQVPECVGCIQAAWINLLPQIIDAMRWKVPVFSEVVLMVA